MYWSLVLKLGPINDYVTLWYFTESSCSYTFSVNETAWTDILHNYYLNKYFWIQRWTFIYHCPVFTFNIYSEFSIILYILRVFLLLHLLSTFLRGFFWFFWSRRRSTLIIINYIFKILKTKLLIYFCWHQLA